MPAPKRTDILLRPDLGSACAAFDLIADQKGFIGTKILKPVRVPTASGKFSLIPLEELLLDADVRRAPGGGYSRGDYTFDEVTFSTQEFGFESVLDDREVAIYADYFDAELYAADRAADRVVREFERQAAALLFDPTAFATATDDVVNEWDDHSAADPIGDVDTASRAVWAATGLWPNAIIMSNGVFRHLRQCDQIVERITASGAGDKATPRQITAAQLGECFDLDQCLVGASPRNVANEGAAASISPVWSDEYVLVARLATSGDLREPALCRAFAWNEEGGLADENTIGLTVEEYSEPARRGQIYRARSSWDMKLILPMTGFLLSNITGHTE